MNTLLVLALLLPSARSSDNVDSVQVAIGKTDANKSVPHPNKPRARHPSGEKTGGAFTSGRHNTNAHKQAEVMSCDNKLEGFITNSVAAGFMDFFGGISGFMKLCPVEAPFLNRGKSCAGQKCLVDPDRFTCCRPKTCTCQNGDAVTGEDCKAEADHHCSECTAGYYLSDASAEGKKTCVANKCECTGGVQTTADGATGDKLCSENGKQDCSACTDGYTFADRQCTANTCTCNNGLQTEAAGSAGSLCNENGVEDCQSCNDGYTPDPAPDSTTTSVCKANTCSRDELPKEDDATYDTTSCRENDITTTMRCKVACRPGYTGGEPESWTCGADGVLNGTLPLCTKKKKKKKKKN